MQVVKIDGNGDIGVQVHYKSGNELKITSKVGEVNLYETAGYVELLFKDDTYIRGSILLEKALLRKLVKLLDEEGV